MTELQALEQKIDILLARLPAVDDSVLWSTAEIASYVGKSPAHVREVLVNQPWFPKPVMGERKGRRWLPEEVKQRIRMNRGRM